MLDDGWAGEKHHCVNTLAFIGPQRDEGPSSGPSSNLFLIDGSGHLGRGAVLSSGSFFFVGVSNR